VTEITAPLCALSYTPFEQTGRAHFILEIDFIMAYVITDTCIKDSLCVEVCPTDCIHPKQDEPEFETATQMDVDPEGCIDCGACIPACTSDSIHALEDVPEDKKDFAEKNAAFYKR
jgi:ferredoxin